MGFTDREKQLMLWASFAALMAAGFGFVFRAMVPQLWGLEFHVTFSEVGQLFGAGLWPIAVMMILNSFLVDKIGYACWPPVFYPSRGLACGAHGGWCHLSVPLHRRGLGNR